MMDLAPLLLLFPFAIVAVCWIKFFYAASAPEMFFYPLIKPLNNKLIEAEGNIQALETEHKVLKEAFENETEEVQTENREELYKRTLSFVDLVAEWERWKRPFYILAKPLFLCPLCMTSVHGGLVFIALWLATGQLFPFGYILVHFALVGGTIAIMDSNNG